MRHVTLFASSLVFLCCTAFGQVVDPVGFCPTATVPTNANQLCSAANGLAGETIGVGNAGFYMYKNGNGGTAVNPWELLVAVPEDMGGAPVISSSSFTLQSGSPVDLGQYLPTSSQTLYEFAGTTGDASMNAPNMFCDGNLNAAKTGCTGPSNETTAFGGFPSFFEVFAYSFKPAIADETAYLFSVGGSGLASGTFLAAAGGTNPFTTPFTVTGLANGPGCNGTDCTAGPGGDSTPEPMSIVLFGTVGLLLTTSIRKRSKTA